MSPVLARVQAAGPTRAAISGFLAAKESILLETSGHSTIFGSSIQLACSGVYGTLGVASASNIPGGRYSSSSWTDSSGNLWLFGGSTVPPGANSNYFNDLWEFSPTSLKWTWMGGGNSSGNQSGVYGTLGLASVSNVPGARYGASSFIDNTGSLWLFGGIGNNSTSGYLNDLWKFNTKTKLTPTITVTPSSFSITASQALTVTIATSGGTGNTTPTGTVTLVGASYTSATATLSSGGATITIPANSLAVGSDTLTATYTPDSSSSSTYNSASGTSSAVSVTTPAGPAGAAAIIQQRPAPLTISPSLD
jgi:hypothetical protein